jgi:hypothetical protein
MARVRAQFHVNFIPWRVSVHNFMLISFPGACPATFLEDFHSMARVRLHSLRIFIPWRVSVHKFIPWRVSVQIP